MPVRKGGTLDPARTRADIVSMATDLLYERGLDGIGIAELCSTMGVSKETLYRHFGSKDELIRTVLEARSERFVTWLNHAASSAGDDPARQLVAVFDALADWHAEPTFRGCAIINAATQQHTRPVRGIAARHLARNLDLLTAIASRAGVRDPACLGTQLLALLEGATILADHHGCTDAAPRAKQAALVLLAAAAAHVPPAERSESV